VIAFAGDALICYFGCLPDDENDMTQCCLRAINCGNELKLLQTNNLSAHIAIDYGPSSLSFIGGYQNMWTYIYDGDCFSSLESCITDAKLKQLVISSAMARHLHTVSRTNEAFELVLLPSENYLVHRTAHSPIPSLSHNPHPLTPSTTSPTGAGRPRRRSSFDIDMHDLCDEADHQIMKSLMAEKLRKFATTKKFNPQLISFVPEPILVNLTQSLSTLAEIVHTASELREVVCMFLKLDSYHPSRHIFSFETLQQFYHTFQHIIYSLGGYIRQIVTDDKGCVCIAMWGVPTASHLNNTMRAVLACSYVAEYCHHHDLKVSVGVTTGDVYCGRIGCSTRCDYAAVGTSINLAARLMALAKTRILLDDQTFYSLDKNLGPQFFKQLPLVTLKGKSEPSQTYEFLALSFSTANSTSGIRPSLSILSSELMNASQFGYRESTTGTVYSAGGGGGGGMNQTGSLRTVNRRFADDLRASASSRSTKASPNSARYPSPCHGEQQQQQQQLQLHQGSEDSIHYSPQLLSRTGSLSHQTSFLNSSTLLALQNGLHQLKTWSERHQGIRLYYDEESFRDDTLIAHTEGKLLQCESFDDHLIQILYVLGIPGTGKTEVTTQLSYYCYAEDIKYLYLTLNDIHYQTEYGLLRLLVSHLIGLDLYSDLMKQKTIVTTLFFEVYPPTHPLPFLIEKFSHLKSLLGLSWFPIEFTVKSKFSKLLTLYRARNHTSTSGTSTSSPSSSSSPSRPPHGEFGTYFEPSSSSTPSPPKESFRSKNTFFALSRNILAFGSDSDDHDNRPPAAAAVAVDPMEAYLKEGGGESSAHNKFLTILLFLKQILLKRPSMAIILDEFQHCDNMSWAILLYLITHLQAPLLFLFTITEPFSHQMKINQSRFFASCDPDDPTPSDGIVGPNHFSESNDGGGGGGGGGQIQFLNTYEPNLIEIQRKSKSTKRFIRSISSLDPSSPQDKLLHKNANKIKIFNYLNRSYFNVLKIQLTGLKRVEVKSLLLNNIQQKNVTTSLVNIVTDLCEGNIYWCKAIIEFIVQYGEDSFCDTFCSSFPQYPVSNNSVLMMRGRSNSDSTSTPRTDRESGGGGGGSSSNGGGGGGGGGGGNYGERRSVASPGKGRHEYPFAPSSNPVPNSPSQKSNHSFSDAVTNFDEEDEQPPVPSSSSTLLPPPRLSSTTTCPSTGRSTSTPRNSNGLNINGNSNSSGGNNNSPTSSPSSHHALLLAGDIILYRLITTLMDSMTYIQKELLKYASVLGLKFSSQLLYQIMHKDFENHLEFTAALETLKKQNFLIEHFAQQLLPSNHMKTTTTTTALSVLNCSFLSHRMRDIIYNLIPGSDACRIHCLIAYHIEQTTLITSTSQSYYELLTFHYYIASTSPFVLTKEDLTAMNQLMNHTVSYLGEASLLDLHDPRPPFLKTNFFLIQELSSSSSSSSSSAASQCKIKSYQYSLLTSILYFQLHEYSKSFGYLKYSVENDEATGAANTTTTGGGGQRIRQQRQQVSIGKGMGMHESYDREVKKLLQAWIELCQLYQGGGGHGNSTSPANQRASVTALLERHIQVCCFFEGFS
jgi:Cdc6-like AAA superfamily ATPase